MQNKDIRATSFGSLDDPSFLDAVKTADVIIGKDSTTGTMRVFHGEELLADARQHPEGPTPLIVAVVFDFERTEHVINLVAKVTEIKGSCCFDLKTLAPHVESVPGKVGYLSPTSTEPVWIPESELTGDIVQVHMIGVGEVWVYRSDLEDSRILHPPFSPETRERIDKIRRALAEVRPLTLEQWEDGFRRDMHTDWEISLMEHIARCYEHFTRHRRLKFPHKRDIYNVILATVNNGKKYVRWTVKAPTLSRRRIEKIANYVQRTFPKDVP